VSIRERPVGSGVWWIFVRHGNKRKAKRVGRREAAEKAAAQIQARLTLGAFGIEHPEERPEILFRDYAKLWLDGYVSAALKKSTHRGYEMELRKHILPEFGKMPLKAITREQVKTLLFRKLNSGLAPGSVQKIKAAISGIFSHALEDGHVQANPAARLGRFLKAKDRVLGKEISPLSAEELELYLETCKAHYPDSYPFFLTLARTGMRLGEALGVQWRDVDFHGGFIEVKRAWVEARITTPKSGKIRRVDMTPHLSDTLQAVKRKAKEAALAAGRELPAWVFASQAGTPLDHRNIRQRVHYRICERARLRHVRIHDLRHSYATIRIQAGHNIADVSKQLGHASIKITVDTYFHWMPSEKREEIAELDTIGQAGRPEKITVMKQPVAT
jgi:integrase